MNARLAALAFRRALPPGVVALALAVLALAATAGWGTSVDAPLAPDAESGLARRGVWTAASLLLAPLILFRAAGTVGAWRRGEIDWIASSPAGRASVLLSTWLGTALAAALVVAAIGTAAELAAGPGGEALQLRARLSAPRVVLVEDGARESWTCADVGPAGELRAHVFLVAGGPAADVRLALERADGTGTEVTRRVAGRTELRAPIPAGSGPLQVTLARQGDGAIVALDPRGLDLLAPVASARRASLELFVALGCALWAWLALGLGLGAWISGPSAAAAVISVTVFTWSRALPGLPWSGVPEALALVGERVVPRGATPAVALATLVTIALGLTLGCAGLRTWRRAR